MKKLSESIINERLKIDKNVKIEKSFKDLKKGDPIYYIFYMGSQIPKIYVGEIDEPLHDGHVNDCYTFSFKRQDSDDVNGILIKKQYIDENPNLKTHEFCGLIICSDKYEIEKILDEHIDKLIIPYQEEINKIQEKINNILKEKENKYYKNTNK